MSKKSHDSYHFPKPYHSSGVWDPKPGRRNPISIGAINASCHTTDDDNAFLDRAVCHFPKPTAGWQYEGRGRDHEPTVERPLNFN